MGDVKALFFIASRFKMEKREASFTIGQKLYERRPQIIEGIVLTHTSPSTQRIMLYYVEVIDYPSS